MLKTSDFNYSLPQELIAQHPCDRRDGSRLMVLERASGKIEHTTFDKITRFIDEKDLLVLNDTRVINARLLGQKYGGGANIELLLDKKVDDNVWEALSRPAKRLDKGSIIEFAKGFYGEVKEKLDEGRVRVYFASVEGFENDLERYGKVPLPPYICQDHQEPGRYQTVYAARSGASAAPTAGLHFTKELLGRIKAGKAYVTLHTGYGTFAPVREKYIKDHKIHSEAYEMSEEALNAVRGTKANNGRVIAVGTTSVRLLESVREAGRGETDIFIFPGYKFNVVDAMVTNFHLPGSTLMMLVCAFAGRDKILKAYGEAIKEKYRFFSFGDAMLIL